MQSLTKFSNLYVSSHTLQSSPNPLSSISLKPLSKPKIILSCSLPPTPQLHHPKPSSKIQNPLSSLIKTTCITMFTTSLFFNNFTKPSIANPIAPIAPTVEEIQETEGEEDKKTEKVLEEYITSNPNDLEAIITLMEVKIQEEKLVEAISLVDRLIKIQPLDTQWPLLKAHLHNYSGEPELAKLAFEEILLKNPLSVEAYHGLVMTVKPSEEIEMDALVERIESAMEKCKMEKRVEELRDFKLLIGQIRYLEGRYHIALEIYEKLVKEQPMDFRPYLYQGIIYTLLGKTKGAKKQFDQYRKLVPKDHPYAKHFEENVMATEAFTQIFERGESS